MLFRQGLHDMKGGAVVLAAYFEEVFEVVVEAVAAVAMHKDEHPANCL